MPRFRACICSNSGGKAHLALMARHFVLTLAICKQSGRLRPTQTPRFPVTGLHNELMRFVDCGVLSNDQGGLPRGQRPAGHCEKAANRKAVQTGQRQDGQSLMCFERPAYVSNTAHQRIHANSTLLMSHAQLCTFRSVMPALGYWSTHMLRLFLACCTQRLATSLSVCFSTHLARHHHSLMLSSLPGAKLAVSLPSVASALKQTAPPHPQPPLPKRNQPICQALPHSAVAKQFYQVKPATSSHEAAVPS